MSSVLPWLLLRAAMPRLQARAAADVVLAATNDQDGVAEAIQRFVLEPARQRRQQQGHVLMS